LFTVSAPVVSKKRSHSTDGDDILLYIPPVFEFT
jgi:hypothetical protein